MKLPDFKIFNKVKGWKFRRTPEVQTETEILSEAKLAGKHRRNVVITLIIPVLFFGAISLGLDRPQKAKEIPCQ